MTQGTNWSQTTLLAPEALELTIRIGIVGSADHCQAQYELRSATDGVLLALEASAHRPLDQLAPVLDNIVRKALAATQANLIPF